MEIIIHQAILLVLYTTRGARGRGGGPGGRTAE